MAGVCADDRRTKSMERMEPMWPVERIQRIPRATMPPGTIAMPVRCMFADGNACGCRFKKKLHVLLEIDVNAEKYEEN